VIGRTAIARRLEATLAATALLLVLALGWEVRPALPQLPRSFSAPLPLSAISAMLEFAAWIVFVLLDLVLIRKVLEFAVRRTPTHTESRVRRAFAQRQRGQPAQSPDWRAHAATLAAPVLRLPAPHTPEPQRVQREAPQDDLNVPSTPADLGLGARDVVPSVLLLGPFELTGCKKKQPRRQATTELIAYLAIQRRPVSRDELLEAFWPGDDPRRSAARLYQAVSEARKLLGDAFQRDHDTYILDRQQLDIDIDDLERLRAEAEMSTGDEQRALLERALALFRGEPLAGIDVLVAESEQRRLTALRMDLLERLGRLRLQSGDGAGAIGLAEEATAVESSNEHATQLAMQAEALLGRREAVVERYERLRVQLDEQFGLQPSPETKRLYRRLLSQEKDDFDGVTPASPASSDSA